jgi:hypothetical protein
MGPESGRPARVVRARLVMRSVSMLFPRLPNQEAKAVWARALARAFGISVDDVRGKRIRRAGDARARRVCPCCGGHA